MAFWWPLPPWRRGRTVFEREQPFEKSAWVVLAMVAGAFALVMTMAAATPRINTIWAASGFYAFFGLVYFGLMRRRLVWQALLAGLIMLVVAWVGYSIGLGLALDGHRYLDHVLLYHGPRLGPVPVDELVWNFCSGAFSLAAYTFLTHQRLVRKRPA